MPTQRISKFILLPELKLQKIERLRQHQSLYHCSKERRPEVCPRCATLCHSTYDHRTVVIEDAPIRGSGIRLKIRKRRLWCRPCKKPFSEPIAGVLPKRRTTQRFRKAVAWAAENFSDLKRVQRAFKCSNDFIYKALYENLELKARSENDYPWPSTIGIDEHHFKRNRGGSQFRPRQFVTMIVDFNNKKLFDVVEGKTGAELKAALHEKHGRENVSNAVIDMCDPYRNFIKEFCLSPSTCLFPSLPLGL